MNEDLDNFEPVAKIIVIGVGGAGNNAVNRMIDENISNVGFYVANTDKQTLSLSKASNRLILGESITNGLGAGGEPSVGKEAAEASEAEIREIVNGANLVFIAAGMGGGTGTGAAPVIAKFAKEAGCLTIAIVTRPFSFEGSRKTQYSIEGLNNLKIIAGEFNVTNVTGDLKSYKGLDNLESIGTFNAIDGITVFSGLGSLKNITKDFIMDTYPAIESLEGLGSLEYIGGNFTPIGSFITFKGLENLNKVEGNFIINTTKNYTPNLSSLDGLSSLSIVNGDFEIMNMPVLQDLKSLSNLNTVAGTLRLTGDLLSVMGLDKLNSVGNLDVSTDIASFDGVNIQYITNISISNCPKLNDLSALSNSVECNVNDITIRNCESLFDFSPFVSLVNNMTGTWLVSGCGYNPTKYQMLNGESKPQE